MAKWFKRSKRSGITYTTYLDGKPTTWSQSYKDGSTRTTYTHRNGCVTVTKTTKQGGYSKIEKHVQNKKQKPKKYKAWKSSHRTKWNKPVRLRKPKAIRAKSVNISFKIIMLLFLFCLSPLIIDIIKTLFN
jgi:hypothetical protein